MIQNTRTSSIIDFKPPSLVERATRRWLERAVIGLNLCPFAAAVHAAGRIEYRVSAAASPGDWLQEFRAAAGWLAAVAPRRCETLLLVHAGLLADFRDFNDFHADCADALSTLGLEGVLQVASFHPQYQFAGTAPGDLGNYTNRAPYPTLHLLREASIGRAVAACGDPAGIYERNIATLNALGLEAWQRLWAED